MLMFYHYDLQCNITRVAANTHGNHIAVNVLEAPINQMHKHVVYYHLIQTFNNDIN